MIGFQILKDVKTKGSFNAIKTFQYSLKRAIVFVFDGTIISLVLIVFHCCKCKKYNRRKATLFIKKG
ncbi:MAG: hypothetical protein C0412_16515 [Flavobacterium sp.]|nr:hypothetical protein [Flavobacterium sp.]